MRHPVQDIDGIEIVPVLFTTLATISQLEIYASLFLAIGVDLDEPGSAFN